jgi:hypothetical protein
MVADSLSMYRSEGMTSHKRSPSPFAGRAGEGERKTNFEHRTLNIEHRTKRLEEDLFISHFDVQCSMFALIFTPTRPPPSRGRGSLVLVE